MIASALAVATALLLSALAPASARAEPAVGMVFKYLGTKPSVSEPVTAAAPSLHAISLSIPWRSVQPYCGSIRRSQWDWRRADQAMRLAQAEGLWVVVTLTGGPACTSRMPGGHFEPTAKWRGEWASFAGRVAGRYGPGGVIPVVRAIEPWNEPNLGKFSGTAAAYRTLFLRTEAAVRRANPRVRTLAAAVALCCEHSVRWLERVYSHPKMRKRGRAVSVHTYARDPITAVRRLARSKRSMPKGAAVWITEHGWSTCADPSGDPLGKCVTPSTQAAFMWEYFELVFRRAKRLNVQSVFWFNGQDLATHESRRDCPSEPNHFFGIWTHSGQAKPAIGAWELLTGADLPDTIGQHGILVGCED